MSGGPVPLISTTVEDRVATLTVAPAGGRVSRAFVQALAETAARLAGATGEVRAVVLAAAGDDFCLGWDEQALAEADAAGGLGAGFDALAAVPQPVVAAIEGRAYSAGLELALACDIRLAGDGASFAMPETGLGLVPLGGGSQRLPRAVGRAHALRLLLTGEEIDAQEARRIGLLSRVVGRGGARDAALEVALVIASRGPVATRMAKEAVHRGVELTLEQALRYELDLTVLLQTTADRAEGVRAFAARRPPNFIGR